ncbi:hypothetical protein SAMN05421810_107176 [Amycolatopsis arida]|uniref:Uncharacterized protein n=1 Tax=Amycolatopsis arida TaxID=587909 RepID=A0A1I5YI05_9PSEU|nr:hypothetical protein CLV69_107176 [Amycolatopsis arida]SFQ43854.1 hypothetical protein SAMN05421810_107176 [Amycolatopsis arida]
MPEVPGVLRAGGCLIAVPGLAPEPWCRCADVLVCACSPTETVATRRARAALAPRTGALLAVAGHPHGCVLVARSGEEVCWPWPVVPVAMAAHDLLVAGWPLRQLAQPRGERPCPRVLRRGVERDGLGERVPGGDRVAAVGRQLAERGEDLGGVVR